MGVLPKASETCDAIRAVERKGSQVVKKLAEKDRLWFRLGFSTLRFDSKATEETTVAGSKSQGMKGERRNKPSDHWRQDCGNEKEGYRATKCRTDGNDNGDIHLKCCYTNANSLIGKMSELKQRTEGKDVVGISESWANENINDAELTIYGFNMFGMDRQR